MRRNVILSEWIKLKDAIGLDYELSEAHREAFRRTFFAGAFAFMNSLRRVQYQPEEVAEHLWDSMEKELDLHREVLLADEKGKGKPPK